MVILVISIQVLLLLILIACWLYFASMIISDLFGVPFVPTRARNLDKIFSYLEISAKDVFYDLGSGDGRLPFYINKNYQIKAVGVELNPLLHLFAQLKKKILKRTQVFFYRRNFFNLNLSEATIIYLFLFPEVVEKLYPKFIAECQKGTVIVSHGFKIKRLDSKKVAELSEKPFATYFYRL